MLKVTVEKKNMAEVKSRLKSMPALFDRARVSAMKSVGNYARHELRNHIEMGGGWKSLHPMTQVMSKSKSGKWAKKSKISPLYFLGRFARYYVDKDGAAHIGLGKSKAGQEGKFDDLLQSWLLKHEEGRRYAITPEMRVKLRAAFLKAGLKVLKRSSQFITVPSRPVIGPVFRKVEKSIPSLFEQRFNAALDRYLTGKDTKTDRIGPESGGE